MIHERDMMHGSDWTDDVDPSGWFVSEKLDGCRAFWDGAQLWSRGGNVIPAPAWFIAGLPAFPLDGEVWAGRGRFDESRLAVQYGRWTRRCRFMVFDSPGARGDWSTRMENVSRALRGASVARPVAFTTCQGREDLLTRLIRVQKAGGEGLMIHRPDVDGYVPGRVRHLLKVK